MKNRNFIKTSIVSLLPIAMAVGSLLGVYKKPIEQARAYSASPLPKTILLDDCSESTIRSYYSGLNNLSDANRKGSNLLKNLKPILMNNQKYYSYDSGDAVWKMYEIIDRDWEKSPASSINGEYGTYNASTNTITEYEYGSNSNPKSNPYVRALYTNRDADNPKRAWGSHGNRNDPATIEREHIWPKSHGFDSGSEAGARGDPMHLWAADGTANGMHSNLFYGYVNTSKTFSDAGNKHDILWGNLTGTSKTVGSGTVFEPQDSDKGDIARACFYMVARYNNLAGNDNNISGANPNLTLSNSLSENNRTGTSTSNDAYSLGILSDLLEWNRLDPPDEFEIHRNNLLYTNFTNNRNPFIDFPEWADIAFGSAAIAANPASDVISTISGETKTVSSISIKENPTVTTYEEGETFDPTGLKLNVTYSDNSTVVISGGFTYSPDRALTSDDTSITISYGGKNTTVPITVNSSGGGEATEGQKYSITFKTNPGSADGTSDLTADAFKNQITTGANHVSTVSAISKAYSGVSGIKVASSKAAGTFTLNMASTISNANAKSISINAVKYSSEASDIKVYINGLSTPSISFNTNNVLTGTATLSNTKISSIKVEANKRCYISEIEIETESSSVSPTSITLNESNLELEIGDSATLKATILPSNASNKTVSWTSSDSSVVSVSTSGALRALKSGSVTITCTSTAVSSVSATCTVAVLDALELHSITIDEPTKTIYNQGEELDFSGFTVTAHYYRGQIETSTQNVTDEAEISGYNPSVLGQQQVTVTFEGKTATFNVTVNEVIEENTVIFNYQNQQYANAQAVSSLTVEGFTVSFVKNNGTQPAYYTYGNAVRIYKNNDIEVTGSYKVKKITIETSSADVELTPSCGTYSNGVWSGTPEDFVRLSKTVSDDFYITRIKVQYDPAQPVSAPLSFITLSGYKTQFYKGDSFSTEGLVVTAHYTDESTEIVNPTSVSTPSMTYNGDKTVTVTYNERGVEATETYTINVKNDIVTSIALSGDYKTSFTLGDSFECSGLVVSAIWESGKTTYPDIATECSIKGYDMDSETEQVVTVSYGGKSATYNITVKKNDIQIEEKTVSLNIGEYATANNIENGTKIPTISVNDEITLAVSSGSNTGKYYTSGNEWRLYQTENATLTVSSPENVKIKTLKITYNSSNTGVLIFNSKNVASDESISVNANSCTLSVGNSGTASNGQVKITEIEVVYEVATGSAKTLSNISISGNYKTEFNVGDEFSFGGTVTAAYSDESTEDVTNEATFSGYDLTTAGNQTVTVTYSDKTTTYSITVSQSIIPPTPVTGLSFSKITTLDDIEEGARYIIGFEDNNTLLAMPNAFENKMAPIELQITSGEVVDTNNECFITLTNVSGTTSMSASITNGEKYLNTSSGTDFTIATSGENWTISCENGEFLFKNGGRSLLYRGGTTNKFGNYAASNVGSEYHKVCLYKEVEIQGPTTYKLVTDASTLGNDDEIIIVGNRNGSYSAMSGYSEANKRMNITAVDINNGVITSNEDCLTFTLEKSSGKYGLKCENGYYSAPGIGNTSAQSKIVSQQDDLSTFSISIAENGAATICANIATGSRYIRYNSSSAFMSCYTSSIIVNDVYIYKKSSQFDADVWSKDFLSKTAGCEISDWDSLAQSYAALSSDARREISTALPVYDEDSNLRQQAAARYDYILGDPRYNVSAFITERAVAPVNRNVLSLINLKDNPTIYIVLFAIAGLTTIGAYIYVKRRKEGVC